MRTTLDFGEDGEMYVLYERRTIFPVTPSDCEWMIPGTHPDDPATR